MSDEVSEATLKAFQKAFADSGGGCVRRCECGHTFFNSDGGWDWNEGELDELQKWATAGQATDLPWAVGTVVFEGRRYVWDCRCWHDRAKRIIVWLNGHRDGIAAFFKAERDRQIAEATALK